MESVALENRPYPYLATSANLLKGVKESAAEGLFKSFQLLLGKDVRENGVKFEVLLGVYSNVIQYVKFLETSLAVGCLNTEFKDLKRMTNGKIQFKISVPTIAHGDGRRPHKQKQYIVMKTANKHHISTEIELAVLDLEILHATQETPLDVTEYVGAVKTITSALQFGVDALERGLVDTVLQVKLRGAPPTFIYKALGDPTLVERGMKKTVKSDLVSMFKTYLIEHSYFLDKAAFMPQGQQYVLGLLSDITAVVCDETVFKGVGSYTTPEGEVVEGVIETTDNVMRKLLTLVGQSGSSIVGPAGYASYVVRGDNLVTAVAYGRAMVTFDQFVAKLVDNPNSAASSSVEDDLSAVSNAAGSVQQKMSIPSSVIRVGDKSVVVESLQRMYTEAQVPFPLNRRVQYSFYFPVGLHLPQPRYSTSNVVKGAENPLYQPTEAWVVNKNNIPLCFSYCTALRSLCHPRVHNPNPCAAALQAAMPKAPERVEAYGLEYVEPNTMNAHRLMYEYYDGKNVAHTTDIVRKTTLSTDDLLHPSAHDVLRLEVHPLYDFYAVGAPGANGAAYRATHRGLTGNLPHSLAPPSLQECRGYQFETASCLSHVADAAVMETVQQSAFDPHYPPICYLVEAMVHGQEDKFVMNRDLIALIVDTYYNNTGRLAFVNSFFMIKSICQHLGGAAVSKEAYSLYRKIYGELVALERALVKMAGHDDIARRHVGEYVNAILDPNLLPPFVYNNIFGTFFDRTDRRAEVYVGNYMVDDYNNMQGVLHVTDRMEDAVGRFANIYNQRVDEDHERRFQLDVGVFRDPDNILVLEKIFYFVFLPVCTNGHVCGMGVDFNNLSLALAYNGPVYVNAVPGGDSILNHLENGTLRDLLEASEVAPTVDMIRTLSTSFLTCPVFTQTARVKTRRDPGQATATHEKGKMVGQTLLVNGFAAFALSDRNRPACETMFFPLPFNVLYSDPLVAATLQPMMADYVNQIPSQRDALGFNVPPTLMAEYEEWHKSPMVQYARCCAPHPLSLSAMLCMHHKLSPVSFINQARNKIHPGFALTVVRTDEVLAENLLYSSRASTSVFVGVPSVSRKEVRSDAVTFEIHHELASLNTSLGYSSALVPAHAAAVTTDMGIHCQDLFAMYPGDQYADRNMQDYIKKKVGASPAQGHGPDARHLLNAGYATACRGPPGLSHGQIATCEVILTPAVADVVYFQASNSPRGRAGSVITVEAYNSDSAETLLYDHSIFDPAYGYRSTNNPWASQLGSLADVMYSASYRQLTSPGMYSPCRQFFTKEEILKNNKGLYTLVTEYMTRLGGAPATSCTDLQYVVINGTDVFLEQPCLFLQEAFPTLSASHRGLLDEYMSYKNTHAPVHYNQFLIEEVAPIKRLFKQGNKAVY
nr:major capsid protein [Equid gammaherpesvirus 5]